MSSDTILSSNRPMKKVFKAPVKGGLATDEKENKIPKAPHTKKLSKSIGSDISAVESSQPVGDVKKVKKIKKVDKTVTKPLPTVEASVEKKVKPTKSLSLNQNNKNVEVKKEKSLTEAEYDEIFSSVLFKTQDENYMYEGKSREQNVFKTEVKHKLSQVVNKDEAQVKKPKFQLTDDSFHTPVFVDLAVKKKKKKTKKDKLKKPKAQLPQVPTSPAGIKTPPSKKPSLPPISPWGSHFAKLNSQGSSFYKPSDDSQSIVGSLFEDDDGSSSGQENKTLLENKTSADSKNEKEDSDSESESLESDTQVSSSQRVRQKSQPGKIEKVPRLSKDTIHRLEMLHEDRNVGLWVFCDNKDCQKQRYLPHITDPLDLPDKWFCNMNPDSKHNSCDKPEHGPSEEEEEYLIHNLYNAGSIVWAHVEGYPWWPAMVDDCPDFETYFWLEDSLTPSWYHVVFFDDNVSRAWLKPPSIAPYIGHEKDKRFKETKRNGINYKERIDNAKKQAAIAATLSTYDRLKTYSFITRYKKPIGNLLKRTPKRKKKESKIIARVEMKAKVQQQRGEKKKKTQDIGKLYQKEKKGQIKECGTTKLNPKKIINHSEEKMTNNKTKTVGCKEMKHPAFGKKVNPKNEINNVISNTLADLAEGQSQGIEFSQKINIQSYICRKSKGDKTNVEGEENIELLSKDDTIIQGRESIDSNQPNKNLQSESILYKDISQKQNNINSTEDKIIQEPKVESNQSKQSLHCEPILNSDMLSVEKEKLSQLSQNQNNIKSEEKKINQEPNKIENNQSKQSLHCEPILHSDMFSVEKEKLSQLSQNQNNIKSEENKVIQEPNKIENNRSNESLHCKPILYNDILSVEKEKLSRLSQMENDTQPGSPDFDVSGEIQNEKVGSTQGTVCGNINEDEDPSGIVTSTSQSSILQNASQDMFANQEVAWYGDAVVPSLSQLSLPFECEE